MSNSTDQSELERPQMGTNQSGMRAQNERLVLSLIRRNGALPKSEIAKRSGLSAQTVSVIMRQLEADKLLRKEKPVRGKVGQPFVPMSLNPKGAFFLGLKIGRRSTELALIDFLGNICGRVRKAHDYPIAPNVLDFAIEQIQNLTNKLPKNDQKNIAGLGIAIPFELWNWAPLIGVEPAKMSHWKTRDLVSELQELLPYPVFLQNDASAACGAELAFGRELKPSHFLYFYIGYFAGGGLVLGNRLFTGPSGNAGALGSMHVQNKTGQKLQLIETSSMATLEKAMHKNGLDTDFMWEDGVDWCVPETFENEWVQDAAYGLAQATHAACAVIDFEAVVIDGWMPEKMCTKLAHALSTEISKLNMAGLNSPKIIQGSMANNARVLGAASLPLFEKYMVDV